MQQLVELRRLHASAPPRRASMSPSRTMSSRCAPPPPLARFARARLQQVERGPRSTENSMSESREVRLEPLLRLEQSAYAAGALGPREMSSGVRMTGHHVLALRVDEELAVEAPLAGDGSRVNADAGAGVVAEVAEHHRDDVDGRARATPGSRARAGSLRLS
jgi:hypothetical protein